VVQVIAFVIGLPLACVTIGGVLWVVNRYHDRPWIVALAAIVPIALMFAGSAGFILLVVARRKARLDAAFVPLGLAGDVYQTLFRQYHGTLQGRQVAAYFFRGPVLQIEVETPLQTRTGITRREHADTRVFAGLLGRKPLPLEDQALGELMVFGLDETWTRRLLAQPTVAARLERLTALEGMFTRQQLVLRPGAWTLLLSGSRRLFGIELPPDQVSAWLEDLVALVAVSERVPEPDVTDDLTALESFGQKTRRRGKYLTLWVALGTLAFFVLVTFVVSVVIFLLFRQGG
jgi:hypothetical protein